MRLQPLIPLAIAAALAACQPMAEDFPASQNAKSLKVEHVRVQYDAAFTPGTANLAPTDTARLEAFLDQAELRPNDRVYVAAAANDPLAQKRLTRLAAYLAPRDLGVVPVAAPSAGVPIDHVVVSVDRFVVQAPPCPNWTETSENGHDNTPSGYYGCATATDLALMVANPRDLMTGSNLTPAQGDPSLAAVQRYRGGQVKPFLSSGSMDDSGGGAGGSSGSSSGSSSTGATTSQ